jgi:hypothetical protein
VGDTVFDRFLDLSFEMFARYPHDFHEGENRFLVYDTNPDGLCFWTPAGPKRAGGRRVHIPLLEEGRLTDEIIRRVEEHMRAGRRGFPIHSTIVVNLWGWNFISFDSAYS